MKHVFISALVFASSLCAQPEIKQFNIAGSGPVAISGSFGGPAMTPVQGAPYSATVVNESIQTLADGNRIVQRTTGTTARDSQGRTRQDTPLPPIGNMSTANAPHIVFVQDPVAQANYTLNLTDKTAHKLPIPPGLPAVGEARVTRMGVISAGVVAQPMIGLQTAFIGRDEGEAKSENLGSQTMEGVPVQGSRTTRTIAAGQIGNDNPIEIVTEVWTSPDLKTIVYSKRTDPRMGEQTFRLTNIVRSEPDASLFTVPQDFKLLDVPEAGKDVIFYKRAQ